MRYLSIYRPTKLAPPTPDMMDKMGKFMHEAISAGVLLATEGFAASTPGDMRVRLTNSALRVTDGPFAETKELIAGFALMQTKTREEMIEWTKRFLAIAGDGECEIHQLSDQSPIEMVKAMQAPCDLKAAR
jgi:hypothetical protein